jgi:RimJ/RimL family protein N-acetyltransferase
MYHRLFLAHGWNLNLRIALQLKKSVKHQSLDKRLVWKKIDNHELFKKCFWYQWFCELYLSADNFLQYASGFALCLGDQVVSEVYDTVGNGYVEISIATNLAHRGKGYALQALAALLEKYEGSSLVPLWTCDADNKASLNTALKMGFEITKYDVWLKV